MGTILKEKRKKGFVYRAEIRLRGKRYTKRFGNKKEAREWIYILEWWVKEEERWAQLSRKEKLDELGRKIRLALRHYYSIYELGESYE